MSDIVLGLGDRTPTKQIKLTISETYILVRIAVFTAYFILIVSQVIKICKVFCRFGKVIETR